jgi:diaminopimelate decarboxylase
VGADLTDFASIDALRDTLRAEFGTLDILVLNAPVPADVKVGDLMVMPVTGAYGYTMASNYNKVPRPAIVFVSNGVARLVTRRETLDDLVRLDV